MAATVTKEQIGAHKTLKDLWILIHGKVYNVTSFAEDHPGGEDILLDMVGKDCGADFDEINHSDGAKDMLKDFYVGDLA